MPAWQFDEDVIEDASDGTIHQVSCPEAPADGQTHAAGTTVVRQLAPKRCWKCWPRYELRLAL